MNSLKKRRLTKWQTEGMIVNMFEVQKKAIKFQEMYYPSDFVLSQKDQGEAIRFAYATGFEMASRSLIDLLKEAAEHIENYDDGMAGWKDRVSEILKS